MKGLTRCPNCGNPTLRKDSMTDRFTFQTEEGESVEVEAVNVPVDVCDGCGERYLGPEAAAVHHAAVCRTLGLLTPEEIRKLRERNGLTQSAFAALTGIGEETVSRWERGQTLQNKAMDRYMRLLVKSAENLQLLTLMGQEQIQQL